MKGSAKVIEILNESLRHELTAVNQYWLHYRLLDDWGMTKLARKERAESIEEMEHADMITARIIFLEGFPNMQHLNSLRIGQNVKEVLEADLASEYSAHELYTRARDLCRDEKDYVSMEMFEKLLHEEEEHIDYIETQLDLYKRMGEQNYVMLQSDSADNAEEG